MSVKISRPVDIENAVRAILEPHLNAYCAPLPEDFETPCVLVRAAGGNSESNWSGAGKLDTFLVTIDSRAELEETALEYLRNAIGIIEAKSGNNCGFSCASVNSLYTWGNDPVRPDLAMCTAALLIAAHREVTTID